MPTSCGQTRLTIATLSHYGHAKLDRHAANGRTIGKGKRTRKKEHVSSLTLDYSVIKR